MKLLIIGGGGHAKVAADVALSTKQYSELVFLDDRYPTHRQVLDFPVLGKTSDLVDIAKAASITHIFIAIGDNAKRLSLFHAAKKHGLMPVNLIHPSAVISQFASLGEGILVMPTAVINAGATMGHASIVNTGAIIEHECVLADAVHVSPNAALAGNVTVGSCTWIGMGASVKQHVHIGQHVIIGVGSVVLRDIQDHVTVVGVPAKPIDRLYT